MTLTPEQSRTLADGGAVLLDIDHFSCVVVRKDVYEKMRAANCDDGDWTDAEMEAIAEQTFDNLDQPEQIS